MTTEQLKSEVERGKILQETLRKLACAAARIVEDDNKPTLEHMRELDRCRRNATHVLSGDGFWENLT